MTFTNNSNTNFAASMSALQTITAQTATKTYKQTRAFSKKVEKGINTNKEEVNEFTKSYIPEIEEIINGKQTIGSKFHAVLGFITDSFNVDYNQPQKEKIDLCG